MITEPKLEYRIERPYVAIRKQVTMQELGTVLPPLIGELFAWLGRQDIAPSGAAFFRYHVIDMEALLDIEVGIPVETAVAGDGRVSPGILPAGRYAVMTHTGPYDDLVDANAALLAWAEENGIAWQMSDDGRTWAARIEWYETDPTQEPDPQKWETELAFLVAEA